LKPSYIFIVLFFLCLLIAQTKPIEGRVVSEEGVVLSDVNIISLPSGKGTKSNGEGQFYLVVPIKDRKLSLNHIGYEPDTINIILYENGVDIILNEKVIVMDSLDVTAADKKQFDPFKDKNNVIFIDIEDISLRGSMDLGDALFSGYPILLNETIDGSKAISMRASSAEEMVFLYDGIRINNMGDALMDLSQLTNLGLIGMELIAGGHEKALASSGTINFIPKLRYETSLVFNQKFGTYNYGGYDGFGSLGLKYGTLNIGKSQVNMSQVYSGADIPEINSTFNRLYINSGIKNLKNFELRLMTFQNEKIFQNIRTNDSVYHKMNNIILKLENSNPSKGNITFFGLYQDSELNENISLDYRKKSDDTQGFGFEYKKVIDNSKFGFSTETHLTGADWTINDDKILLDRQSSIFTGSFEIYQLETDKKIQFQDLKFVFSKHRVTDIPNLSVDDLILGNSVDNNNVQFTASLLNKQLNRKVLFYMNIGNVFRVPSVGELISNQISPFYQYQNKIVPEKKSMYEMGMKINSNDKSDRSYVLNISIFSYQYYDKIKQIYLSGTPIKYPINFGRASLSGIETNLTYQPKIEWINFKTYLSNYYFSDPTAFQLQPDKMLRNIMTINNKWFNMELIQRSESSRQITTVGQNEIHNQTRLEPITNFDINIYKRLQIGNFKTSFNFSIKNINSSSQTLEGISIYDKRYSLNISIAIE